MQRIKNYFSFDKKEAKHILATCLALGFIFSFTEWGMKGFDLISGVFALLNSALIILFSLLARISVQKVVGIYRGYKVNYESWPIGLAIALFLTFFLNGQLLFFAVPGVITLAVIEHLRVGKRRQAKMQSDTALISFSGILTSLAIAYLFNAIAGSNIAIAKLILINVWLAVASVLPIPPLDGFNIFYYSRIAGIFAIIFTIGAAITLYTLSPLLSLVTALAAALGFAIFVLIRFELGEWK